MIRKLPNLNKCYVKSADCTTFFNLIFTSKSNILKKNLENISKLSLLEQKNFQNQILPNIRGKLSQNL